MADAPIAVTASEALTMHEGRPHGNFLALPETVRTNVEQGRRLRDLKAKDVPARDVIVEARREKDVRVDPKQVNDMIAQFGGGYTKLDGENVIMDDDKTKDLSPEDQSRLTESFSSGEKALKEVAAYLTYAQTLQEANATGRSYQEIYDRENPGAKVTWDQLRANALDALLTTGLLERIEPSFIGQSDVIKRDFIETALASDPKLRMRVAQEMRRIEDELTNLPKVQENEKQATAVAQKELADKEKEQRITEYHAHLQAIGVDLPRDTLVTLIDRGLTPDNIFQAIRRTYIEGDADLSRLDELDAIIPEFNAIRDKVEGKDPGKVNPELQKRYDALRSRKEELETLTKDMEYKDDKKQRLKDIKSAIDKDSDVGKILRVATQAHLASKAAEREVAIAKATTNERQTLSYRLRKEGDLRAEIENILNNAMVDVLAERSSEVHGLKTKEQAEKEAEAEKTRTKEDEEAQKKVKEGMERNWISADRRDRKRTIDKEQIGRDMRMIAYEGEDGIKRLMLRDMGVGNWETADLGSLPDDVKRQLEAAHGKYGDTYRDTLMKDYFIARAAGGRGGGELKLKDHEWELLNSHFSTALEKGLKDSEAAQRVMEDLKKKGIVPSNSLKWLLYVLLGVGTVAAVAAGAAYAAGPASGIGAKGALAGLLPH